MAQKSKSRNSKGVRKLGHKAKTFMFWPRPESIQNRTKIECQNTRQNCPNTGQFWRSILFWSKPELRNSDFNVLYTVSKLRPRSKFLMKELTPKSYCIKTERSRAEAKLKDVPNLMFKTGLSISSITHDTLIRLTWDFTGIHRTQGATMLKKATQSSFECNQVESAIYYTRIAKTDSQNVF